MPTIVTENRTFKLPYETRGTRKDLGNTNNKEACEATGGVWDEATKTCTPKAATREVQGVGPTGRITTKREPLSLKEREENAVKEAEARKQAQTPQSKGSYDPERGGFVDKDGTFYATSNPDFVPGQTDRDVTFNQSGTVTVAGADGKPVELTPEEYQTYLGGAGNLTQGVQEAQAQPNIGQVQLQAALGRIGQVGKISPAQEAAVNFSQAATAGAAGILPGVIGGAAGGAVIGAAGGPIGAGVGAVLGGVGTFISGTIGNIKQQQKGEIQAAKEELTAARTNMRQLAMLASRDPANADYYISLYNEQLTRVHQARAQTKVETSGDLNGWVEDGRAELAEFDVFLRPGGIADIYGQKLEVSLQTGVPLSVTGDELFLDEEGAI